MSIEKDIGNLIMTFQCFADEVVDVQLRNNGRERENKRTEK